MKKWKTTGCYEIIQVMHGRSNVFLLTNGEKNILIDSTVSRLWSKLQRRLERLGISKIDYLILTHAHFDHAGNANRVKNRFNALVMVQKQEANYLSKGDNILPNGTTIFTRLIVNIFGKRLFSRFKYEPCHHDFSVDSYFDLKGCGFNAYLMHTPGHTIGSMSVIVDNEIAIVGDTLYGVFKSSVFPPYAEDTELMIQSWGKLLETNCSVFLPSHGTERASSLIQQEYSKRTNNYRIQQRV
jgi:hydroxyacylglutathione hydrolase